MTNRKILMAVLLASTTAGCAANKPEGQITFKVVNEDGRRLGGVPIRVDTLDYIKLGDGFGESIYKQTTVISDKEGYAQIKETSQNPEFSYRVWDLPGYYRQGGAYAFSGATNGYWQPRNPTVDVVLKPILNPVAVYRNHVELNIPKIGVPVGYDLMVGDWVAPHGKGVKSDFVFQLERKPDQTLKSGGPYNRDTKLFEATLTLAFSNEDDGIQSVLTDPNDGSELRLPRYSPEDGYQPQLSKRTFRESVDESIVTGTRKDQNYFFRVRTVKKDGKIVSALYGKIDGDVSLDVINSPTAIVLFKYHLNPEPNSRNMEFDPKKNLFKK